MKKVLIGFAAVLFLVLAALFTLPFLFKDKIMAEIKNAANQNLNAIVGFSDVSLSMFRHFPHASVGVENLSITGTGVFDGVKLVECPRLDITVDLWSILFGSNMKINGIYLQKPDLKVYVLSNGMANYDITIPSAEKPSATTEPSGAKIALEHYEINEGNLLYDDRGLDMRAEIKGLNHEGSGEFTSDIFDLKMKTAIEQLSVAYGGIEYLKRAKTDWTTTLNADLSNMKFTLKENSLRVNALDLDLNGSVAMPNDDDIVMDLSFGTPANTFKSLLSLVPGAYVQDFDQVQANGTVQFNGYAKGTYNETTYPAFQINFKVGNADFKYPSLPLGVTNINVDASVNSPSQRLDDMKVSIPSFSLRIGSNALQGHFYLSRPETNPTVDTKIDGVLNLGELAKAFPMEGVQQLSGILRANLVAKASMNQIDQQQYGQVQMQGSFGAEGITLRADGQPPVTINALQTSLSPQRVEISSFDARLGKSDIKASGSIDNVLAYFSPNKTMVGSLNFRSAYFDANEWMPKEEASDNAKVPTDSEPASTEKVFDAWDFTVDGEIRRLIYDSYNLQNLVLKGHFLPNKMTLQQFGVLIDKSDLSGSGQILNAWNYLFDNQTLSGAINLKSNYFDLNPFMTDDAAPAQTAEPAPPADVVVIPKNVEMAVNADFGQVQYTNQTLRDVRGRITVKNGVAALEDCTAGILGGQVALSGAYDTENPAKPAFNMDMALQNMGFKESYQSFVTIQKLAPVAQMIDGRFSTTLSISGILGQNMMPDLNTLAAAGYLETINAVLSGFKGMQEIGNRLNLEYLTKLELGNTKNWFEIRDGKVTVKPFDVKARDVSMQIGGSHGLNQEMDYQIIAKIPRKSLEKTAAGSAVNTGLKWISGEASKFGVNVAQGEFINMQFNLTGLLNSPNVGVKVLGSDGQATLQDQAQSTVQATLDKAKDSLRTVASQQFDAAKAKAEAAAQKAADSLRRVAEKKVEEVKTQVGDKVGQEVEKKANEVLGQEGQKKAEEVKKKLESWDPFKKKKN